MPRELIDKYLRDPLALGIAAAILILLIVVVVLLVLRSRRRKREREDRIREKLLVMERQTQFAAAAEQVQYLRSCVEVAQELVSLFRDYLLMDILALYVGREGEARLTNILPKTETVAASKGNQPKLADAVTSSLISEYWRPQVTTLAAFVESKAGYFSDAQKQSAPVQPSLAHNQQPDQATRTGESIAAAAESREVITAPLDLAIGGGSKLVLAWRGAFKWNGLIVAVTRESVDADSFTRYREPLVRLSNRLAVALELERERAEIAAIERRSDRSVAFFRSLISILDAPSPFAAIAREVASLVGSDSAALWRVEPGSSMVRMVAAYGLRSAEFLPLPFGQGFAGSIVESGEPLMIEDAPADPRCLFPREARESGIGSYLGVPVIVEGRAVGVVEAHATQPRKWTSTDLRSAQSVAEVIGEVIRSADARGNRLRVESAYLGLSEAMQRLRSRDEVMEAAVEVLGHALGVSRAIIVELGDNGQPAPVRHEFLASGVKSAVGATFSPDLGNRALNASLGGEPAEIADSRLQSLMDADAASEFQLLSELAVPIKLEGQLRGLVYLHQCDRVREWQRDEVEFADRVGRQLALSLSNVRAMESAAQQASAAREELQRGAEVLARAQGIVKALPEAVIGLDREGRVAFFNPAARDWLGLKNEDLGRMAEMTESLAMSDESVWDRVMKSETATRFRSELIRHTGADSEQAETASASLSVAPIRNEHEQITGHLVVLNEISHLDEAPNNAGSGGEQLRQKLAELERAMSEMQQSLQLAQRNEESAQSAAQQLLEINRLKSEFIVNAGREMESSLHSFMGFAELLHQGSYGPLAPDQAEAVRRMYAWARRMKADIDNLIEYGSSRSRRLEPGAEGQAV